LPAGWAAVVVVLSWLPLTVRTSWPLPVLAAVLTADTAHIALAGHAHPAAGALPAATMLALYTVATRYPAPVAWTAAAAAGVTQFTVALVSYPHPRPDLLYLNWAVVATALGLLIRDRRERIAAADQRAEAAEHSKQAEADRQVTAERIRIAHELHDVLAHHIAVVNAQAGVAQYLLRTDPHAADTALAGIAANAQRAPGQFHRRRHAAYRRRPRRTRLTERTGRPRVLPDRAGGPHQRHQTRSRQRRQPQHRLVRRIRSPHCQ
jgi:signal transduction histidine kinase